MVRLLRLVGALSLVSLSRAEDTIIDLGYAQYRGNLSYPNTVAYLGLPYAEPPVAERRWRAPLPLNTTRVTQEARGAVIDASKDPEFCIQGTDYYNGNGLIGGAGSEDCLKVNVYAPLGAKQGDKLPVLVYMHGGGYVFGNPANFPFDHWVHQVPEVVIVSIYYRLDSFGFLSHPAFATDPSLGDLNLGIQDQTQALRWVQNNIDTFGGDPNQVTINGESAGGSSVEIHLIAPQQEGLFHAAIAQSVYRTPLPSPEQQEPLFNFYAEWAGCNKDTIQETMACLRNASVSTLAPAEDTPFNGSYNIFRPVLDGKIISQRPTAAILAGNIPNVRLIVGATSNDTLIQAGHDFDTGLEQAFPMLSPADLAQYHEVYPLSDFDDATQLAIIGTGESELRCAVEIMGDTWSKLNDTYVYRYNTPNPTLGSPLVGHAAENWMMFKGTNVGVNGTTTFSPTTPSEDAFAEELIAYWLSFVRSGNPNTYKLDRSPQWPAYTHDSAQRIVLTEGSTTESGSAVETIPSEEVTRCAFVASKYVDQQN